MGQQSSESQIFHRRFLLSSVATCVIGASVVWAARTIRSGIEEASDGLGGATKPINIRFNNRYSMTPQTPWVIVTIENLDKITARNVEVLIEVANDGHPDFIPDPEISSNSVILRTREVVTDAATVLRSPAKSFRVRLGTIAPDEFIEYAFRPKGGQIRAAYVEVKSDEGTWISRW